MLERIAIACFVASALAVAITARVFPEMNLWSAALVAVALLQVARLFRPSLSDFAAPLAHVASVIALAAVLLSLLAGTIGGSFHIDEPIQPVLWSLAAVSVSGVLHLLAERRAARSSAI